MSKDYYKILGVDKKASKEEIKKAFYKLAHQHHPDKNQGKDEKFKEVNEAYQVLSDDKKRNTYDRTGATAGQQTSGAGGSQNHQSGGFEGFDFSDFSNFGGGGGFQFDFGDLFGSQNSGRKNRGEDLQVLIEISLEEVFKGATKKINYARTAKCETCRGDGAKPDSKKHECKTCKGQGKVTKISRTIFGNFQSQTICIDCEGEGKISDTKCTECKGYGVKQKKEELNIPIHAGVEDGGNLTMRGYGESVKNGESGDLYIQIRVKQEKNLIVKNKTLYAKVHLKKGEFLTQKQKDLIEQLQKEF